MTNDLEKMKKYSLLEEEYKYKKDKFRIFKEIFKFINFYIVPFFLLFILIDVIIGIFIFVSFYLLTRILWVRYWNKERVSEYVENEMSKRKSEIKNLKYNKK